MDQAITDLFIFLIGLIAFIESVRMLQLGIDSLRAKDERFYLTRTTSIGFTLLSPVMAFCGMWFMAAAVI